MYSESDLNPIKISEIKPNYNEESVNEDGRIILRENFDAILKKNNNVLIFGQDSGKIGGVNQGLEGLQKKYGEIRVFDTGIREATIIGQGIGLALRGLRPIAEIQYLDYLLYAIQIMSDDLASLHYRTRGKQKAPLIIRTRGHRLEGIWHSGSPMGGILNLIRGIFLLVPRNMTKAAGFYNTLLEGDQPALVIECLNKYRSKEKLPSNLGDFKTPIGKIDYIRSGNDITIVSYGSTLELVQKASEELQNFNIDCEIIDCQSLIPFDLDHDIAKSIEKTNRFIESISFEVPATWFQSLNAGFIVLFAVAVGKFWTWWSSLGRESSLLFQMAVGVIIMALGFAVMSEAALEFERNGSSAMYYLVLAYLLHTLGELCTSPTAMALITKLAPVKNASIMMISLIHI